MARTVAREEHQSKDFNVQLKISPLTVNNSASGHKKSEGNEDRVGLAQWGNRKVMKDI